LAAILFSGGTLGTPKGILLSHRNFVSQSLEAAAWVSLSEGDRVLAALPIFHGFGLGALINASFMRGCQVILVPTFSAALVARLIRQKRPNLIAGVPTLYDSLSRDPSLRRADLSCLRAAFSGGDTLPGPVKQRFEELVRERGGRVRLLEGYGLTETVTAVMATPLEFERAGSMGVPFPDTLVRIHRPGTEEELPPGDDGEICVSGPTVMLGYLDDPAATSSALRRHRDGRVWLRTGDIGRRDQDGFFYFRGRLKRMIKSSGFNVYPAEVEEVLCQHPAVAEAHVVGVPDESQGQRVKAFVVPNRPTTPELAEALILHCRTRLIKWSCPRDVEFRQEFPRTGVGKVDEGALLRGNG
jgi:long-chain acyl-CoA synthetase